MDSDFWCWLRREADCLGALIVLLFFLYLNRGAGLGDMARESLNLENGPASMGIEHLTLSSTAPVVKAGHSISM